VNGDPKTAVRRSTLLITNLIKVTGLGLAVREILTDRDPVVIATCVVMMSGAQGVEQALIAFLEKFLGNPGK
jgi:hypothetical protein